MAVFFQAFTRKNVDHCRPVVNLAKAACVNLNRRFTRAYSFLSVGSSDCLKKHISISLDLVALFNVIVNRGIG